MSCPTHIRIPALIIGLAGLLSAIGGVGVSAAGSEFFLLAFESVVLIASIFGVYVGIRRMDGAEVPTMLCLGTAMGVGAVLGLPYMVARVIQGGSSLPHSVAGVNLIPWWILRVAMALALFALAGAAVVSRTPRTSMAHLLRGVLVGLPVLILAGVVAMPRVRGGLAGLSPPLLVFMASVGFLLIAALVAVCGHNLIRAFEVGMDAEEKRALTRSDQSDPGKADRPNP